MEKHLIEFKNVTKEFNGEPVLKDINLYINEKEFVTLLGPSGCGKTTLLRILGGFETPTSGSVFFDGEDLTSLPPYKRQLNTVFQEYALFPHMDVYENIAFGLKIQKLAAKEIDERVADMLSLVNLTGYEKRSVEHLSGGQQQRVAIARAVINRPKVLLLDEPLGALDLKLRKGMQIELKALQQKLGITFVFVTHDQGEALTMSDTIVVMKAGVIEQIGTPIDVYNEPKNAYVADFIGESNIIKGTMIKDFYVRFLDVEFECLDSGFGENCPVDVVVRPEDVKVVNAQNGEISGRVISTLFMGVHYEIKILANGFEWSIHSTQKYEVGEILGIHLVPYDIHVMKRSSQ